MAAGLGLALMDLPQGNDVHAAWLGMMLLAAGQLEEVLVTAQRRSEDSQRIPVAVSSLSAADLTRSDVVSTTSLSLAVPGLMFMQGSEHEATAVHPRRRIDDQLRGRGGRRSNLRRWRPEHHEPGTPRCSSSTMLERVEVLKGPQERSSGATRRVA